LLVARELAAPAGGIRSGDSGAFVSREHDRRLVIRPGQPHQGAGDAALLVPGGRLRTAASA